MVGDYSNSLSPSAAGNVMKSDASNNTSPVMDTGFNCPSKEIDPAETKFIASSPNLYVVSEPAGQHINTENMLNDLRNLVSELQERLKEVKKHYAERLMLMKTRGRTEDDINTLLDDFIQKITDLVTDMEDKKNILEALNSPQMAPQLAEVEDLDKICIDFIEESHAELVILKVLLEARRKRTHKFRI